MSAQSTPPHAERQNTRQRIDAAHPAANPLEARPDEPGPPDESGSEVVTATALPDLQRLRNHASQLAAHLHSMRQEIDRREAELNARTAEADKEMRAARLWLQERQEELEQRAAELDQRERAVSQSTAALAAAVGRQNVSAADDAQLSENLAAAVAKLQQQRQRQESELHKQQQQIDFRRQASVALVQQLLRGVERRRQAVEEDYQRRQRQLRSLKQQSFQEDYQKAVDEFTARHQHLDEAEAILANSQSDLDVQRAQLKAERERAETQMRSIRLQLVERQRELDAQWQQRQAALARRSEQLDSRQAAIGQAREEVADLHREALALRLATQELWLKLSQVAPAPALATELTHIRRRLEESYGMQRNAALEEKQQLQNAHKKLADQYIKLSAEKKQLHDWVTRREQDIEQQAARLIAREQELDRQRIEQAEMMNQWQQDRHAYHERIRGLTRQLRRQPLSRQEKVAAA
ncbi:MAG: hypothetical protein GTO53_01900 [Planctomycetales bacterium]|nr:hypothetical protein [Planctomycetales bacterium]NIM07925.1 hypothetical protein [Planctomycetales bacterium]NIN07412.1 hypothetical protein [Planctomycetales bacterium]NIN76516.1 hypothetical protein [Planctomycetales bacterium]NIO33706.1 hypothetical protein [Planctomycetales bacterium]